MAHLDLWSPDPQGRESSERASVASGLRSKAGIREQEEERNGTSKGNKDRGVLES